MRLWFLVQLLEAAWPEDEYYAPVPNQQEFIDIRQRYVPDPPLPDRETYFNPYLIDLDLEMPRSRAHQCAIPSYYPSPTKYDEPRNGTDQAICWSLMVPSLVCESCCSQTEATIKKQGNCWDYVPAPNWVPAGKIEEYCCKGKLKPDFAANKAAVIKMSEAEGVRPPTCYDHESEMDLARNPYYWPDTPRSCFEPILGLSCEACCFDPDTHPVQWSSYNRENVKKSKCWSHDIMKSTMGPAFDTTQPYDKWTKCCQDYMCDASISVTTCLIMPFVPYIALGFFLLVVVLCAVFEWALIGNKLCFRNPPKDEDPFAFVNNAATEAKRASTKSAGQVAPAQTE
jgi:hypothetical protein